MLLRRIFGGLSFVSFVLIAFAPGCDDDEEAVCEALRDDATPGSTTIRIVNARAETIHLQGPGGCSAGVFVDGEPAVGAILVGCDDALDGELFVGDCEPEFLQIEAGDALDIIWDRRFQSYETVPEGCENDGDEVLAEFCIQRVALDEGPHTVEIRYGLDFGEDDLSVEVDFDLPTDEIEITLEP